MGAYSVIRKRLRPSWNKYNLLNLATKRAPPSRNKTLYQQKWEGKQETRAYHGEHLTEKQFQNLFESKLQGVAKHKDEKDVPTPLQSQTFAPLERRLDTALFRAMFASSVRQARQTIIRGKVTVNGTMMRHPSYPLQPGDLFAVDPKSVLVAVGRTKPRLNDIPANSRLEDSEVASGEEAASAKRATQLEVESSKEIDSSEQKSPTEESISGGTMSTESITQKRTNEALKSSSEQDKTANENESRGTGEPGLGLEQTQNVVAPESKSVLPNSADEDVTKKDDSYYLGRENQAKPFWTPWEPRPFMSPFAFYPTYIEVSPQTCSAIYLRDPVARPGLSEVPSPLPLNMHALAYSFYARNRK